MSDLHLARTLASAWKRQRRYAQVLLLLALGDLKQARPGCTESALPARSEEAGWKERIDIKKEVVEGLAEVDRRT